MGGKVIRKWETVAARVGDYAAAEKHYRARCIAYLSHWTPLRCSRDGCFGKATPPAAHAPDQEWSGPPLCIRHRK